MKVITVLEGIKKKVSAATRVSYLKGCELAFAALPPIPAENLYPPNASQGEHGLRGEYFTNMTLSGEPALVRTDPQINFDWGTTSPDPRIPPVSFSVRWTGVLVPKVTGAWLLSTTTDDGVRFYVDGRLLVDSWIDRGPTPDYVEMKLEAGRRYNIRIEYYQHTAGAVAGLGWSLKPSLDAEIAKATATAKRADVVIFVAGINEGEGRDRAYLDLPGPQEDFIKALVATGVPTVVVLIDGSAVTMNNWIGAVPAIVEAWYPGEEGGTAVADVLFGDYNPGGKLPITFPQTVGQTPLYYNPKPSGRGYDYVTGSGKPLFPFGYGLSYTQFAYSNLQVVPEKSGPTENVEVRVDVRNVGARQGDEVVQFYLHAQVTGIARPLKELKAFKRISLAPGEEKPVTFLLTPEQLSVLNLEMNSVVEPGTFEVMVGGSSEDTRARGRFEIQSR
jgi:beta-glucosidase